MCVFTHTPLRARVVVVVVVVFLGGCFVLFVFSPDIGSLLDFHHNMCPTRTLLTSGLKSTLFVGATESYSKTVWFAGTSTKVFVNEK